VGNYSQGKLYLNYLLDWEAYGMTATSFEYIEVFYNRKRSHTTLGYKSPMQFMAIWINAQQNKKLVA
jgi:hypothetical protein